MCTEGNRLRCVVVHCSYCSPINWECCQPVVMWQRYFAQFFRSHRSTSYVDAAYCYRPSSVICRSVCHTSEHCKNGWTDRATVWVEDSGGPRKPRIRWGSRYPIGRGKLGEISAHCRYRDFLSWAVQERLNGSICRLDCGLGWAKGSTRSIVFARWHQCVYMGRHNGATWRIRLNSPSAAVMRSYVKLLWPLVFL